MKTKHLRNSFNGLLGLALIVAMFLLTGCGGGGGGASGTPATPSIALDKVSIDFGNRVINQTANLGVTVQNTGTATLTVSVTDPGGAFSVTNTCGSVAAGASCTLNVSFTPTLQQDYAANFLINSNAANASSVQVAVTGTGKGLSVKISSLGVECNTDTVTAKVVVNDSANQPVSGLDADDFTIYLDGGKIDILLGTFQQIAAPEPVSVALALDWSNSFASSQPDIKQASKAFIDLLADTDRAAVFKFAAAVDVNAQPFIDVGTGDVLKAAVDDVFIGATNLTKLWDAADYAVDQTAVELNSRAVILLTDGDDDGSVTTLNQLIANANTNNVTFFTIGFGTVYEVDSLERLAEETGGKYFYAPTGVELGDIYDSIASILINQWQFSFTGPGPGIASELTVVVVSGGGLEGEDTRDVPVCP